MLGHTWNTVAHFGIRQDLTLSQILRYWKEFKDHLHQKYHHSRKILNLSSIGLQPNNSNDTEFLENVHIFLSGG